MVAITKLATALALSLYRCATFFFVASNLRRLIDLVNILLQIESILETDLIAKTCVLHPLPSLLHSVAFDNGLLGTGDVVAVNGYVNCFIARLNGGPVGDSVGG